MVNLYHMDSSQFDWITWRSGSLIDLLGVNNRGESIIKNKEKIKKYAVGWCKSEQTPCRPKTGYYSVMFLIDDNMFWTHLTYKEFNSIFNI